MATHAKIAADLSGGDNAVGVIARIADHTDLVGQSAGGGFATVAARYNWNLVLTRIVTAEADFDKVPGIIRLGPADNTEWQLA